MLATSPPCAAPGVNTLALPQLKRKRSHSSDPTPGQDAPVATKLRADDAPAHPVAPTQKLESVDDSPCDPISTSTDASHPPNSTSDGSTPADGDVASRKVDVDRLRETIEAQLSLEVLLKHNEMRLIDLEIAKCQVALEQLRRCAEIPYPASQPAGLSPSVSAGTGMAVLAPGNGPAPRSPAPWGVADGPYTRHYARWLLPDPRFDGGEIEPGTPAVIGAVGTPTVEGRSTRGSAGDAGFAAGKSRSQRGSAASARLQSLPNGYPAPKEKAGPMIIRRKSDGVMVKLICLDCRRDNFSSTQGFINHCRIAHNRNFASHDAAAVASGEPVEVNEAGAIVGGTSEPPSTAAAGYVHPLIRSAHVIEPSSKTPSSGSATSGGDQATPRKPSTSGRQESSAVETPRASVHPLLGKQTTPATANVSNVSFMASPDTPHLSSLMQLRGVSLDLDRLVGEAKTTIDLGAYSSDEGESDGEQEQPPAGEAQDQQNSLGGRVGRQPMRTTASQATSRRPGSSKGVDKTSHRPFPIETLTPTRPAPYQSPYAPTTSSRPTQLLELREVDGLDRSSNLSPNTMESNQAPSLVSDDEDDYEEASDSESLGPSSSEAGDHEEDFSHIDVAGDEDGTASSATTDPKTHPRISGAAAHPSASLPKPLRRGNARKKERVLSSSVVPPLNRDRDERRVSFARGQFPNFHPDHITRDTFDRLLNCYPVTVEAITRRKAAERAARSSSAAAKKAKKSRSSSSATREQQPDHDATQTEQVDREVQDFLRLDERRYQGLPELVKNRAEGSNGGGGFLTKEELVEVMEWKLKHGVSRPMLLGMVKGNQEKVVQKATSDAFAAVPGHGLELKDEGNDDADGEVDEFPKSSLDMLTGPLRGVGPATASLLLSVGTGVGDPPLEVPFYSDDTFLWLCLGEVPSTNDPKDDAPGGEAGEEPAKKKQRASIFKPSGEINVKYNAQEYRQLWDAVRALRKRLNKAESSAGHVSCADVEKVALVLRHLDASGFLETETRESSSSDRKRKRNGKTG
ncbi:hypothetical protein P170DRAFT_369681 [Aspergillus steynii IBT 23096]|uniref:AHC1-like C2H2 zinc-finger domain-containing protein n=1 Tax=Aspergillus steynii IBT 23096 TaxID=1392250 RepID=A0A2I2FTM2_9EURO|nr:uncharacterized protein P170DRAFT_369681 [Aspergillus steynii IBT 23096]PLB43998.1 hypothetical protein P170DRAFT_369681 [Aspergillus steynii IBT 23096]